jgi:hypothetical protein
MVGEGLTLDQNGQKSQAAGVDEAALLEQPRIHVIEKNACPGRHLDEPSALWAQFGFAAEGGDQLTLEGQSFASASRSPVDRTESLELHPDHRCRQAVSRVGAALGQDALRRHRVVAMDHGCSFAHLSHRHPKESENQVHTERRWTEEPLMWTSLSCARAIFSTPKLRIKGSPPACILP